MTITELIKAIKESKLTKEMVGGYYDQMCMLYFEMQEKTADLEKAEALYIMAHRDGKESDISIKRSWNVTEQGLELMKMKRQLKGMEKLLGSLKRRTYELL